MEKKHRVLADHIKKGSTFYPPFAIENSGFNFIQVGWRQVILPELFWMASFVDKFGMERARNLCCELVNTAGDESKWAGFPNTGCISSFLSMSPKQKKRTSDRLDSHGLLEDICDALAPLCRLYPRCPLRFLLRGSPPRIRKRDAMETLRPLLSECLFRGEKLPTLIQGIYYDINVNSGRMHFAKGLKPQDTSTLDDYPESDSSKSTAAFLRAHANSIGQLGTQTFWPKYFWDSGNRLGECFTRADNFAPLWTHSQEFILYQLECFRSYNEQSMRIWEQIESHRSFNLYSPLQEEILYGLATRIYRLTVQAVSFPPNWTEDVGQVFVRLAAESYIYWKWLREVGTDDDIKNFYEHGLGQQKLYMEHINAYLSEQGMTQAEIEKVNPGLDFLKNHKMSEFISVNVGPPLGKNLRQISEEVDLKELYTLVFGPTSSMIHGMYDSLDRYYLRRCHNPFHCLHRIPFYWSKSPISFYGPANLLTLTDWLFADLLSDLDQSEPETMPGRAYCESFFDEEAFQEFSTRIQAEQAGKDHDFASWQRDQFTRILDKR